MLWALEASEVTRIVNAFKHKLFSISISNGDLVVAKFQERSSSRGRWTWTENLSQPYVNKTKQNHQILTFMKHHIFFPSQQLKYQTVKNQQETTLDVVVYIGCKSFFREHFPYWPTDRIKFQHPLPDGTTVHHKARQERFQAWGIYFLVFWGPPSRTSQKWQAPSTAKKKIVE